MTAIARVPMGHGNIGRCADQAVPRLGIQTLLVPMVDTPEQARELVRACAIRPTASAAWRPRAPPAGANPMAPRRPTARSACWCRRRRAAIANLDAIAAVEGVDGVFIGPADLSAAFGHVGDLGIPRCRTIEDASSASKAGKAVASTLDETLARKHVEMGATFIALGTDSNLMVKGHQRSAAKFKGAAVQPRRPRSRRTTAGGDP